MSADPQPRPAPSQQRRSSVIAAVLLCAVATAVVAPATFSVGWTLEEIAGMLPAPTIWEFPGDEPPAAEREPSEGLRFYRESRYPLTLPVWGVMNDEAFYPLMIDGHIGALPGYPYRWLFRSFGPHGPRVLTLLLALATVAATFSLARRLFGLGGGVAAASLLISTTLFAFAFSWNNYSEQWSAVLPIMALLAAVRFGESGRLRWLLLGAFVAGLAVAAKNTAVWTFIAGLGATAAFRLWPRVTVRQALLALGAACLPMLPQLTMMATSPATETLAARVGRIPLPWQAFTPERVTDISKHYVEAFLSWTDFVVPFIRPEEPRSTFEVPGLGAVLLVGTVAVMGLTFVRPLGRHIRAFGLGVALLLIQYMAFYYVGQSAFILLLVWIPVGIGGVSWLLVRRALRARLAAVRWGGPALVALVLAAFLVNNAAELRLWIRATTEPTGGLWNREAQLAAAAELEARGVSDAWTTTYGLGGVLELVSDGALRPRNAYPIFATACTNEGRLTQEEAWLEVLRRMGAGRHWLLLSPDASQVEISPCRNGVDVMRGFEEATATSGTHVELVRTWVSEGGVESFRLVTLDVPEALPPRRPDWP